MVNYELLIINYELSIINCEYYAHDTIQASPKTRLDIHFVIIISQGFPRLRRDSPCAITDRLA